VTLDRNGLEVLDRSECLRLMKTQTLGRIGVTVDALPVVLPVNFQLFDGEVIIQTERDTRLADATQNTVVAFEVDNAEAGGAGSWSVTLTGIATEISDPEVIVQLRRLPFTRWVRNDNDRYVGISLDLVSGRRVTDDGGDGASGG
jgi:nitroimidazol reductase NimA-like FMN-containing flavoprotein (pyridoxamine 5'-phosphate oxidase superfamily)